ncbi:hypothetical protein [Nonomuraea sp. NPDC002799]
MRYVLIEADGTYLQPAGSGIDLGPEGATRVPLGPMPDGLGPVTGWVNAAGSPTYPANPVGGQVLVAMGAASGDYFGPVIFTGWDPVAEEIRGMNSDQAYVIQQAYDDIAP